jgi:segregation and condensation protein A
MKAFEKVVQKLHERNNKPVHTVIQYNHTMEESRDYMLDHCRTQKTTSFEKIFEICQDKIHAIFLFLSLLELSQQKYLMIVTGEGRNNFIVEYNENREEDIDSSINYNEMTSFN